MRSFCLAVAACALAPAAAAQDVGLPTYEDVGLAWTRAPSIRDMARQYDVATRAHGERGVVELSCTPTAAGRLGCDVVSESPEGWGFGRAGVNVMSRARVAAVDGGSPEGRTFGYRLRFGNWPSSMLPDAFQPAQYGLRWVRHPVMRRWGMGGLGRGDRISQAFDCLADHRGRLACQISGPVADAAFAEAGLASLAAARVERDDGSSPDGVRFPWTITVERQSHCGGGQSSEGADAQSAASVAYFDPALSSDPSVTNDSLAPDARMTGGAARCAGAMVQVAN